MGYRNLGQDNAFKARTGPSTPIFLRLTTSEQPELVPTMTLPTLEQWTHKRVVNIFEAPNKAETLKEIEMTFSPAVNASLNGIPITREYIDTLITNMRPSPEAQLKLSWRELLGSPSDPAERVGRLILLFHPWLRV